MATVSNGKKPEPVDATLAATVNALIAWADDQKNVIINAGQAMSRQSWAVLGDMKTVTTGAALPTTAKKGEYSLGQLAFATSEDKLYQLTDTATIVGSENITLVWTYIDQEGGSLFRSEMLHSLFSRKLLELAYKTEYNSEDGRADLAMVAKIQADWLSAFERDSRYRYRTAMRSRFHHGATKRVEADQNGSIGLVTRFIKQAYAQLGTLPVTDNNGVVAIADISESQGASV